MTEKEKIGNKGSAMSIWLTALASIFVVALVYIIFNQVLYSPYGLVMTVNSSFNQTLAPTLNLTQPLGTMTLIQTIWNYWPLVAIFGILFWAFWKSVGGREGEI